MEQVDSAELHTITRHCDDPKLEIGDAVSLKDGVHGVVIARYTPSGHKDEVRYVVQVHPEQRGKGRH